MPKPREIWGLPRRLVLLSLAIVVLMVVTAYGLVVVMRPYTEWVGENVLEPAAIILEDKAAEIKETRGG